MQVKSLASNKIEMATHKSWEQSKNVNFERIEIAEAKLPHSKNCTARQKASDS